MDDHWHDPQHLASDARARAHRATVLAVTALTTDEPTDVADRIITIVQAHR